MGFRDGIPTNLFDLSERPYNKKNVPDSVKTINLFANPTEVVSLLIVDRRLLSQIVKELFHSESRIPNFKLKIRNQQFEKSETEEWS